MCNDERLLHIMQNPFIHTYMYIIHSSIFPQPCIKKDTSIVGCDDILPYACLLYVLLLLIFYRNRNALVTPRFLCEGLLSVTRLYLNIIEMLSEIYEPHVWLIFGIL